MPLIEIEDDHLITQVGDIIPAEMNEGELRECMAMLCVEGADIREQLSDPTRTGEGWRIRAQDALRHRIREFEDCRVEAIRRGMPNLPDIDPYRERARLDRVSRFQRSMAHLADQQKKREAMAEIQREKAKRDAVKTAEKLALHAAHSASEAKKFKGKAACFVAAAKILLSREQRHEIWEKARAMFPNDLAWTEDVEEAA